MAFLGPACLLFVAAPNAAIRLHPQLFSPGVISTDLDEFGGALTPDGSQFYFSVSVPRFFLETICYSTYRHGKWNRPKVVPWSGLHHDFDPCLSPDGQKMFFISDRPIGHETKTDYDVWQLERKGSGWSKPVHVPEPVSSKGGEHFASCADNGDLYVCSDRDGKANRVYRIPNLKGQYGPAELLPPEVNGEGDTLESSISPDGKILVSAIIGRHDSLGLYDLYISFKEGGKWTPMANLGPEINSSARDYTPRVSTDGKWLFYASETGFDNPRTRKQLTYKTLNAGCDSLLNGYGNIYKVPMADVLRRFGR